MKNLAKRGGGRALRLSVAGEKSDLAVSKRTPMRSSENQYDRLGKEDGGGGAVKSQCARSTK